MALEFQLVRARRHLLAAEREAATLVGAGNRVRRAEAAQAARASSHEIDLVYDGLRDLHDRATALRRDPAFLRTEDAFRAYEEIVARRSCGDDCDCDDFEADFRAGIARCGGLCGEVFLVEDVHFCDSCGVGNCQVRRTKNFAFFAKLHLMYICRSCIVYVRM